MRRFIWASSYFASGIAAGCISAYVMIQQAGLAPVEAGAPWLSRAAALADKGAYYARAHYLLEGRLPPAPGQITEATAEADSDGRPLTGNCDYLIRSTAKLPPWWSLSIVEQAASAPPLQSTADSDTAVREADGSVRIHAGQSPLPGNWLKAPDRRRFTLLYSALPPGPAAVPPFAIARENCW